MVFAAQDAKVAQHSPTTRSSTATPSTTRRQTTSLASAPKRVVHPEITYDTNDNVRFIRRDLSDGGALTYIRNTGTTTNTITLRADAKYATFYWLDQATGRHDPT